jgi:spore coat polysaccharide biosynthesis predicted glycosyltransferase SpsG
MAPQRVGKVSKLGILVPYSNSYGLGHYFRNQHFLEKFPDTIFFTDEKDITVSFIEKIKVDHYLESYLISKGIKVLLVDHFFLGHEQLNVLRSFSNITIIYFDPNLKEDGFPALINNNPFSTSNPNISCKQFVGAEFYGFPQVIYSVKNAEFKKNNQVFICLGGSDPNELTEKLLYKLCNTGLQISAVLGPAVRSTYRKSLIDKFLSFPCITFFNSPKNFYELLSKSSVAILSCSTLTYEATLLRTPFVAIQYAKNQLQLMSFYYQNGVKVISQEDIDLYFNSLDFLKDARLPSVQFSYKIDELYNFIKGQLVLA